MHVSSFLKICHPLLEFFTRRVDPWMPCWKLSINSVRKHLRWLVSLAKFVGDGSGGDGFSLHGFLLGVPHVSCAVC